MSTITAVIKARNEERNIPRCLTAIRPFVDEIIVIDDASSDATAEIAAHFGARVVSGVKHDGRIDKLDKQGFELATGQYILRLDADERPTPKLLTILRAVAHEGQYTGVKYARRYYYFNGWLDHGGWFRSNHLGFFETHSWDRSWDCALHSQVPVRGPLLTLPADREACSLHYNYDSVRQFVLRSLAGYAVDEGHQAAGRPSPRRLLTRPARRLVGRLLVRRGYRDGMRGVVAASLLACYEVVLESSLWEAKYPRDEYIQVEEA